MPMVETRPIMLFAPTGYLDIFSNCRNATVFASTIFSINSILLRLGGVRDLLSCLRRCLDDFVLLVSLYILNLLINPRWTLICGNEQPCSGLPVRTRNRKAGNFACPCGNESGPYHKSLLV